MRMRTTPTVRFVAELPVNPKRPSRWDEIAAELMTRPFTWALIDAKGGYPRQRLKDLGCEVRVVAGQTYARWVA